MRNTGWMVGSLLGALAIGCTGSHGIEDEPTVEVITSPGPSAFTAPRTTLEACLEGGGALVEVASVNNDDVREHGDMLTFAVADDRRIAVAAEDGTIKLWTLEGFLGELTPGELLYGVETTRTVVNDLAFDADWIVAGDVAGLVSAWTMEGGFRVVGGTDPDVGIVAVAIDRRQRRIAHVDERGFVMVRGLEDATTFGPLETDMVLVRDVAYLPDGRLLVAGGVGHSAAPALELRGAADPTVVLARWTEEDAFAGIDEVAVAPMGETVAAIAADVVAALGPDLSPRWIARDPAHVPVSVAITASGRAVLSAGAEGALIARSGADGAELARVEVSDPVAVRVDPTGNVVLVGSRAGMLHAFACR